MSSKINYSNASEYGTTTTSTRLVLFFIKRFNFYPSSLYCLLTDKVSFLNEINKLFSIEDTVFSESHFNEHSSINRYHFYKEGIIINESNDTDDKMEDPRFADICYYDKEVGLKIREIAEKYMVAKTKSNSNKINFIIKNTNGFFLKSFKFSETEVNIDDHYNDDFKPIHENIVKRLNNKNDKGIVLLHSDPGAGKSTYIKHLTTLVDKKFIFMSADMVSFISSPELIPFLSDHPNTVLVIEEAENILRQRSEHSGQAIGNILNLGDGLLAEAFNIQVIATFNCKIDDIDKALLRKGRMIAKYNFQNLSIEKTNNLLKKIGFDYISDVPMSLADIFNINDEDFNDKKTTKKIGFR